MHICTHSHLEVEDLHVVKLWTSLGQGRHMGLYQLLLFIVFGVIVSKDTDTAVTLLSLPRTGEQESRDP